jgi:hypothetical protein
MKSPRGGGKSLRLQQSPINYPAASNGVSGGKDSNAASGDEFPLMHKAGTVNNFSPLMLGIPVSTKYYSIILVLWPAIYKNKRTVLDRPLIFYNTSATWGL